MSSSFLDLLSVGHGHFKLESGMHGDVWFDLERAFVKPRHLDPFVTELSRLLTSYKPDAICGALVGGAFVGYSVALILGTDFLYAERFENSSNNERKVGYRLAEEFQANIAGKRVAVVDDAINAGSAVLKTCSQLTKFGARPIVLASLLTVGGKAPKKLPGNDLPIISLEHLESNLWQPKECPLCMAGELLIDPYDK